MVRIAGRLAGAVVVAVLALDTATAQPSFADWLAAQWPAAEALGISRATFERETAGLEPDYSLPDLAIDGKTPAPGAGQAEFVMSPEAYLSTIELAELAERARTLSPDYLHAVDAIEKRYGVPGRLVLAIWGRETALGAAKLEHDALRVLATEAYAGRRKDEFLREFLSALQILDEGSALRPEFKSSWAGAMGPTQFMPSDYLKYGVDGNGDGRVDIWTSVPDALASAANLLAANGWDPGQRWGYEVRVPSGFDCTEASRLVTRPASDWLASGIVPVGGRTIPADKLGEPSSIEMPAGPYGPAFIIAKNFGVLKDYNDADLYALFVGHLADQIEDGRPFVTPWAKADPLRAGDLQSIQAALAKQGFYSGAIDGLAGPQTRAAIGTYQKARGLPIDCSPSAALLDQIGQNNK